MPLTRDQRIERAASRIERTPDPWGMLLIVGVTMYATVRAGSIVAAAWVFNRSPLFLRRVLMRSLIALALILVAAEAATAGPIRNRIAARRGCSSCQQPSGVAFRPAASAASAGASVTCAGGVCRPAPASFAPLALPASSCPGGVCLPPSIRR